MSTKLWVSAFKGPMDTQKFSNILKRRFTEGGVAALTLQNWRHVSVAILDAHFKSHFSALACGENEMIDCQRGHSSQTANKSYGGRGDYNVDRESETQFKAASEALHQFWAVSMLLIQLIYD